MSNERKEKNAPIKQSALAAGVITEAEKLQAQKNAARKRYRLMSMTLVAIIVVAVVLLLVRVAPDSLTQLLNPDSTLGTDSSAGQDEEIMPEITKLESTVGGIKLTWEPVEGVGKYRVYVQASDGTWSKVGDTTDTTFVYADATVGESYTFTIRGRDKYDTDYITEYNHRLGAYI